MNSDDLGKSGNSSTDWIPLSKAAFFFIRSSNEGIILAKTKKKIKKIKTFNKKKVEHESLMMEGEGDKDLEAVLLLSLVI